MNKKLLAGAVAALAALSSTALAADHGDGPQVLMGNAPLDITDVYTWTDQSDATKFDLVMDVTPNATAGTSVFSTSGQYVFHLTSFAKYGAPLSVAPKDESQLLCTFAGTPQVVSCWLIVNGSTVDYVTGDASAPAGIPSTNGNFKIFTGPRQDPFFFNLDGFNNAIAFVEAHAAGLTFNTQGCPAIDPATSGVVVNDLGTAADGSPAVDHFAGFDVLSIVVQMKTAAVTPSDTSTSTHPVIGVWASTLN